MQALHPITIQQNPDSNLLEIIRELVPSQVFVLTDSNTKRHCYPLVKMLLPKHHLHTIKAGEVHKNLKTCEQIWEWLTRLGADRSALLVNLGGGVVGDMGGFCAAVYKRGIRFLQMPTTLLAMADASVGGKTGIDFLDFKNQLGVFAQPSHVVVCTAFLNTLPVHEYYSGLAEVAKHCLIADQAKWNELRIQEPMELNTFEWVQHAIKVKSEITAQDPHETGLRKALNFGHTVGHAIESWFLHQGKPVLHGYAVAAGMVIESYIAMKKKFISADELEAIEEYLISNFGTLTVPEPAFNTIISLMKQDKKNASGKLMMALPQGIGQVNVQVPVSTAEVMKALNWYIASE